MEDYDYESDEEEVESPIEQGGLSSTEEGFMKGYLDEDKVKECAECGAALRHNSLAKEIDGEELNFCSRSCAEDYKESL